MLNKMVTVFINNFKYVFQLLVFQLLYKTVVLSVVYVYIVDVRQGYCYYRLANDGRCLQHSDRVAAVTQPACCCTGGAAWGPKCEKCPAVGTGISTLCH